MLIVDISVFTSKMNNRFWVYIIASKTGTLYTGITNSLDRRILEHKNHLVPGFTAKYHYTRLRWFEKYAVVSAAIAREKQIKGWLRSKKVALIEASNPHGADLAAQWGAELCLKVGIRPRSNSEIKSDGEGLPE